MGSEAGDDGIGGMVMIGGEGGRGYKRGLDFKGIGGGGKGSEGRAGGFEFDWPLPSTIPSIESLFVVTCRMWSGVPSTSGFLNLTCLSSSS
jgi:hypothetical protein